MAMSFGGPQAQSELVGRSAELLSLEKILTGAASGFAGAAAILGEPGIGKTRVLGELCKRAAALEFEILGGRGAEFEQEIPYGLVVDALDERFRMLEMQVIDDLGSDRTAELAAVFPSLAGRRGHVASRQLEVERFEFYRAVRFTLQQLARRRPLLLVLDDTHWADPASVELIAHLLRRPVPGVAVVLAYRPRQAPRQLLGSVEQAARENLLLELELDPLGLSEAAALLGGKLDSGIVGELHAESGGNPFYLEQLARVAQSDGTRRQKRSGKGISDSGVPAAVRAALAQELDVLPPSTLEVLRTAAVVGDPFNVDLVADVVAFDEIRVTDCLDALAEADLIRVTAMAGSFRFRHPIVRKVVYDDAMPGWRYNAHKRAACALARRGASISARAHHVERSASLGDEQAVAILTEAGHLVTARAPAAAAGWFEAALRLLPEASSFERRLSLTISLAGALAASGSLHESRAALEEALGLLPAGATRDRVRIVRMMARADNGLGRAEEARRLIAAALDRTTLAGADAIVLQMELAQNQLMMRQWEQAITTMRQAQAQAQALDDPTLVLSTTSTLAWFSSYQTTLEESNALIDVAADGMDARDVDLTPALLEALADLVYAEMCVDRYRAASRHAERGLRVSRAMGHGYVFSRFTLGMTASKLFLGQLHDARAAAETAVEAALLLDNDQLLSTAETLRCWVEIMSGDVRMAVTAGRAAVRAADRQPDALFTWLAHACYGEALIESGEIERGRQEILSLGTSSTVDVPPSSGPTLYQALVTAELSVGRLDAAKALADRIGEEASLGPSREGNAHYAHARVHFALGDFVAAAASAQASVRCFDKVEMCVWAGRSRLLVGKSLGMSGQASAAILELEHAYGIFQEAGAERLRDEAAKELRLLGRRVRRQPTIEQSTDVIVLTERERGIANLVVQGFSNREIAAELFVSPKTVEKHLARVFAKLGISSRAGVAAALSRHRGNSP